MALSRHRKGKFEFSTLLFAHRVVACFSEQPNSLADALHLIAYPAAKEIN
jgi:hypothetical protein